MIDAALEARLVRELGSRDAQTRTAALAELFECLGRPLYQVCLRVACDPTDAEDARQETFVEVLRALPNFRGEARFSTWVFRIAIRAALRVKSKRTSERERTVSPLDNDPLAAVSGRERGEEDPSALALEREGAAKVLAAIERLPAAQRAVLALAALDDLPQVEIAEILGLPVGTVYSRLSAARERLREELAH